MLTINVAVLPAVIIVVRLRRRTQAHFEQGVLDVVGQLAAGINDSGC
ncbi:hypothetical protein [Streptomyces sp. NPDC058985]